jgi:hypothetical protein
MRWIKSAPSTLTSNRVFCYFFRFREIRHLRGNPFADWRPFSMCSSRMRRSLSAFSAPYMRDFKVAVPYDCIASETRRQYRFALDHMTDRFKADTRTSEKIRFP